MLMAITAALALAEGQEQSDLAVSNGEPPPALPPSPGKGGLWSLAGAQEPFGEQGGALSSAPAAAGRWCCLPSWGHSTQDAEECGTGTATAAGWRRERAPNRQW